MSENHPHSLEALRAEYRQLQSTASQRVSAAVSQSSRIFSDISKPVRTVVRDSFETTASRKAITKNIAPEEEVVSTSSKVACDGIVLHAAVPLIGDSGDLNSLFLNLVSELMRPHERSCDFPVPLSSYSARNSPALSVATSRTSATSIRPKSLPPRPRGFGSSTARFAYERPPSFAERVKAASISRKNPKSGIGSLGG